MEESIRVKDVVKNYPHDGGEVTALSLTELSIPVAENTVLITGESGAGKTTLLNLIGLLDKPTSGEVSINSRAVSGLDEEEKAFLRRTFFGFVFQSGNLIPTLTVMENILVPLFPHDIRDARKRNRLAGMLEKVGLTKRKNHLPAELSAGEQQRAAIVRALANNPRVILADEPTAHLDPENAGLISDFLIGLTREHKMLLIIAGNDTSVLRGQAYKLIQLKAGKIAG